MLRASVILTRNLRMSAFARQIVYTDEELRPDFRMMDRIVEELKKNGKTVVIPGRESFAREESVQVLQKLMQNGVRPEFLIDASVKNASLFGSLVSQPAPFLQTLETLVNVGYVTFEDAIRLFSLFPEELLRHGSDNIGKSIEALSACGISAPRVISSAIKRCPPLLFARNPQEMQRLAHEIGAFFSKKQASHLISKCPQILLKPIEEIEEKYEYMFYQMCIESDELSECVRWIEDLSLDDIIDRHKFLLATGKYSTPDPKRPQIRFENPKLVRILDTSDEEFATNVARVSVEEWVVFKALRVKETINEKKQRKFDRVKPSKRKAYERRHKEREELGEHVFDVSR